MHYPRRKVPICKYGLETGKIKFSAYQTGILFNKWMKSIHMTERLLCLFLRHITLTSDHQRGHGLTMCFISFLFLFFCVFTYSVWTQMR